MSAPQHETVTPAEAARRVRYSLGLQRSDKIPALTDPIALPTRPMRPSDYGTPETNVPALVYAAVFTVAVLGFAVALVLS